MQKLNLILVVLLVVQLVLTAVLFWPRTSASTGGQPLFADLNPDEVVSLTITDGEGGRLALAGGEEGWTLPEADDFPAQEDQITPVLDDLANLTTDRLVTRTEGSHRRLQVSEDGFNRLLDVEMRDGSRHELYVGSSGGTGATHIRREGSPDVYLTAGLDPWELDTQASNWIDTLYFTAPQTATVNLLLENRNGTFEFVREGEGWVMTGLADEENFDDSAFTQLLGQATSIRMKEPLGKEETPEYGLDNTQATVTLTTELDGVTETYETRLGAKDENGDFVLHVSGEPYYVRVTGYVGGSFAEKTREDFIVPPSTPEPDPLSGVDSPLSFTTESPLLSDQMLPGVVAEGVIPSPEIGTTPTVASEMTATLTSGDITIVAPEGASLDVPQTEQTATAQAGTVSDQPQAAPTATMASVSEATADSPVTQPISPTVEVGATP